MKQKLFSGIAIASFIIGLLIFYYGKGFVRFYVGDIVVVIFLYAVLSVFSSWKPWGKASVVGMTALAIECAQLFITHPGNGLQQITLGAYFDPLDLVAYMAGLVVGICIDRVVQNR